MERIGIIWFRADLRLFDNAALRAAAEYGRVLPLVVWDECEGRAAQVWRHEAVKGLAASLSALGVQLVVRQGRAQTVVPEVALASGATRVFASKRYEPSLEAEDREVAESLPTDVEIKFLPGALLYEPAEVAALHSRWSDFYTPGHDCWGKLFPFWRACLSLGPPPRPLPSPTDLLGADFAEGDQTFFQGTDVGWRAKLRKAIGEVVDEAAGRELLRSFVADELRGYERRRHRADLLDDNANSRLSPFLRWGQVSPRELYWSVAQANLGKKVCNTFARRVFWRDHAYYQLTQFPRMPDLALRPAYRVFPWCEGAEGARLLLAWQTGRTGYPLVDAGMRELWATGRMQQNIRMLVAAFLVEHCHVSWVEGRRWFADTLVDADEAINSMMWQSAGRCGGDQWSFSKSPGVGEAIDPTGGYVHQWVPELRILQPPLCYRPWEASTDVLAEVSFELGRDYPHRCVEESAQAFQGKVLSARLKICEDPRQNSERGYDIIELPSFGDVEVGTEEQYCLDRAGQPFLASIAENL